MTMRMGALSSPLLWDENDEVLVYKSLEVRDRGTTWVSPYLKEPYPKEGEMISDRSSKELTQEETNTKIIRKGLHFYVQQEHATDGDIVVAFRGKKEDLVAEGEFLCDPVVVFMKATIVGLVEKKRKEEYIED